MVEFISRVNIPDPGNPSQRIVGYRIKRDDGGLWEQLEAIPEIKDGQLVLPSSFASGNPPGDE